jgi:nucleoside-diphosphate-sugar epimerase
MCFLVTGAAGFVASDLARRTRTGGDTTRIDEQLDRAPATGLAAG